MPSPYESSSRTQGGAAIGMHGEGKVDAVSQDA